MNVMLHNCPQEVTVRIRKSAHWITSCAPYRPRQCSQASWAAYEHRVEWWRPPTGGVVLDTEVGEPSGMRMAIGLTLVLLEIYFKNREKKNCK